MFPFLPSIAWLVDLGGSRSSSCCFALDEAVRNDGQTVTGQFLNKAKAKWLEGRERAFSAGRACEGGSKREGWPAVVCALLFFTIRRARFWHLRSRARWEPEPRSSFHIHHAPLLSLIQPSNQLTTQPHHEVPHSSLPPSCSFGSLCCDSDGSLSCFFVGATCCCQAYQRTHEEHDREMGRTTNQRKGDWTESQWGKYCDEWNNSRMSYATSIPY